MKTLEFVILGNTNLKTCWVYNWTNLLFALLLLVLNIQPAICQVLDEPHIPIMIERSIKTGFQADFLNDRLNAQRNLNNESLNYEYYIYGLGNFNTLLMDVKPISKLFGVSLKNTCFIEVAKPYTFINGASKKNETYNLNDSLFPFGSKFLIYYETKEDSYPFPVDLHYISGNFNSEASPYWWILPLLGEDNTEIKRNAKAAELYLKFRLFSFSASEPKLDRRAAKNLELDYWSFLVNKIDITGGRACEARVYKGYSGDHIDAYVIDLIYYVDSIPKEFSQLASDVRGTYKVTWRISYRFREYFYPEYKLLSDIEKKELIAQGKFYPFFHEN